MNHNLIVSRIDDLLQAAANGGIIKLFDYPDESGLKKGDMIQTPTELIEEARKLLLTLDTRNQN